MIMFISDSGATKESMNRIISFFATKTKSLFFAIVVFVLSVREITLLPFDLAYLSMLTDFLSILDSLCRRVYLLRSCVTYSHKLYRHLN